MDIKTKCVREGYLPKNGEPLVMPIYQSTTFKYDTGEHLADLFDLKASGFFYSRLANPSLDFVEQKIASLEGGSACMLTSSGQSAALIAFLNICKAGDHIVSSASIYGGVFNLLSVTLKKYGIETTFVDPCDSYENIQKAFTKNTKAFFAETISNPTLVVADIEKLSKIAHDNHVPFIIDNTFATPFLCTPFSYGADIIIHSTSKYLDGHATALGGAIVEKGDFDWENGKFEDFTTPDDSYHGLVYARDCKGMAFTIKARVQLMRDFGAIPSPFQAFILNSGIDTLHLRMERHSQNALQIAKFLESNDNVSWVNYPLLESNSGYTLAQKYLANGASGVLSFGLKQGKEAAIKFMNSLKLITIATHVADIRTMVIHPASTTHRQLSEEQLKASNISPELVRLSVGIEDVNDLINDIKQAF